MERVYQNTLGPVDSLLQMHDGAAAVTADGVGQVSAAAKILDLGDDDFDGVSYVKGQLQIHVSAFDFTTGDEEVLIWFELSSDSDFSVAANVVKRAGFILGNGRDSGADVTGLKRYTLPVDNEVGDTRYRYARVRFDVSGTTPSITCKIWLNKDPMVK